MRLRYFVLILGCIVILSLVYTWQQVEITKLVYREGRNNKAYKELLDKNRYLGYNLASLKSSSSLGNKILKDNTKFELPGSKQMRKVTMPKSKGVVNTQDVFIKDGIFLSMIKIKEAWPVAFIKSYIDKQAQAEDYRP